MTTTDQNGEVAISRVRYLVTVKQKMIENRTMQGTSEIPA